MMISLKMMISMKNSYCFFLNNFYILFDVVLSSTI